MSDFCLREDTIVAGNLTFDLFTPAYNHNLSCGPSTYLRPEKGGSLIPWPYLAILVIIHGPVIWQRITHWENVQMVALALAVFSVATTVVGYWSTALTADQVLVWAPLQLLLDNGAMSQLYLLIQGKDRRFRSVWYTARNTPRPWRLLRPPQEPFAGTALRRRERQQRAWVAVLACLLFIAMLILQIIGFGYAIKALAQYFRAKELKVPWCSPFLQNYVVAVYDRGVINTHTNCPDFQNPMMDSNKGIGCLNLKAKRQMDFLWATVVILPLSFILEVVDFWQLMPEAATFDKRPWWRRVVGFITGERNEVEDAVAEEIEEEENASNFDARPWLTMLFGFIILIALAVISGYHSMHLPDGISKSIWVFRHDPSTDSFGACVGQMHASGIRGSLLAWSDGLFDFMKKVYLGG